MNVNKTFYYSLIKEIFKSLILNELGYSIDMEFPIDVKIQLLNYFRERVWKPKNIGIQPFGFLYKDMKHFRVTGSHSMGSAPMFIDIRTLEISDKI